MKRLLLSSVLVLSLGECLMPSGINPTLGCSPITGCQSKDYYLPGKGVWAPKPMFGKKATIGALGGAAAGAYLGGGDPLTSAGYAVVGMVLGHTVGDHFDKVDHIYGTMLIKQSLNHNPDGVSSTWKNPNKDVVVTNTPIATNGTCREFITDVQVSNKMRKMRGTACKHNGVWELKELYK